MTVMLANLRFELMRLVVYWTDLSERTKLRFTLESAEMAGCLDELGCSYEDAQLALKESAAIGHVEQRGYVFVPTEKGRAWVAAEDAVRQSAASARGAA